MAHYGNKTADKASNTEYGNSYYKTSESESKIKSEQIVIGNENAGKLGTTNRCQYFKKILRFLTITAVILTTVYVSAKASKRYINNWVQTVIERTDVHIGEIPFPAVSICPLIGINWTHIPHMKIQLLGNNYSAVIEEQFDQQLRKLIYAQQMGDFEKNGRDSLNGSVSHADGIQLSNDDGYAWKSETSNYTWNDLQQMLVYNCGKFFKKCFWRSVELPCCEIFRFTPIYRGYCFSFNMLHNEVIIVLNNVKLVSDLSPIFPKKKKESNESSLRTSFGTGTGNGLRVYVHKMKMDKLTIVVHEPSVEPDTQAKFLDGQRTVIMVNPIRFTSDPEIATIHPTLRRCYFTSEMQKMNLTESACRRKCRLKYVLNKCNCSLETETILQSVTNEVNITTEFCSLANVGCLNDLEDYINFYESKNHYEEALYRSGLNCCCYHNCDYVQYDASVYGADSSVEDLSANFTELQVYYQHSTFFSYRSTLVATWVDLLVSYGGIAGLFLGISAMSLIECFKQSCGRWKRRIIDLYIYLKHIIHSLSY
ncbi:pickpocket protein 19 [Zeugodacus cucurbitae]|uniref:pickpocket protein 19 n=1 Tax=Zeugodacus cucurbitae TaxID=28588 RepID=UPI0023D8F856|nr:pickpocket protein 19 [Zeugodacus cucurbitae]